MEERFTGPLVGTSTKPVLFPSPPSYFILRSIFPGFGFFEDLLRFLGALWDSGVWYIAVWNTSGGAVRGKFWGGIGVSGWGLLVFCCFNSVSRGSDDWVVGTAWGLNSRVTVSRGVMGVSDWGNKGSDIKGEVDVVISCEGGSDSGSVVSIE